MAYYEDIIINKGEINCNLCLVPLENNDHAVNAHVNEEKHKSLEVKRSLMLESIVIGPDNIYCNGCNKIIVGDVKVHLETRMHTDNIKTIIELMKRDGFLLDIKITAGHELTTDCVLCGCSIKFDLISQHLSSEIHRRIRAIAVQPFNGIFSVDGDDDYLWCKFCQTFIDNRIEVIFDHVDNNTDHITDVTKILNLIKNQNICMENFLMDPKEDKIHCKKCDTYVPCNIDNLERHVHGKKHKK